MGEQDSGLDSRTEQELIDSRRRAAGVQQTGRPWALAFSGGGIRSATFCLGLTRALAQNGLFSRFDYLSTVSGGGYIGSAIGRLFSKKASAPRVSAALSDDRSLFLWWLRSNGRFLLPAGFGDTLQAGTSYARGTLATHVEVGVLALLMSCLVILPHMLMLQFEPLLAWGSALVNPWWSLLPLAAIGALALLAAYWFARDGGSGRTGDIVWCLLLFALAALLAGCALRRPMHDGMFWALAIPAAVLLTGPLGGLIRACFRGVAPPHVRLRLTFWLSRLIAVAVLMLLVGALELLTWGAAAKLNQVTADLYAGGIGFTAALVLVLRFAVPAIQKFLAQPGRGSWLIPALNAAGLLLTILVATLWLIGAQWFVYFFPLEPGAAVCGGTVGSCGLNPLALLDGVFGRWLLLTAALLVYILLTGPNADQVNRSSLHPFYRSRLARAYVSVGNSPDHTTASGSRRFEVSPLERAERSSTELIGKVGEFLEGDDVELRHYRPYESGGPIHLVNCCVNQTIDDRTGGYNADRKGVNLAVSPLGVELGTREPYDDGMLGRSGLAQWVAISGAAVGPGMGSASRFGLAALSFLSGVRLGFWWTRSRAEFASRPRLAKYTATLREWFGKFPGLHSSPLYLSDGGHFDNTGIYALLKRRPELIVAADCGADPDYLFADIENLIRKARIDYNAKIEFIHPASLRGEARLKDYLPLFGTPDSVTADPKSAFLLFATVAYGNNEKGAILFVKPRRVRRLPLDIAGYSDRDHRFPQQSTGDQFFDEAQWESYCELGRMLGQQITPDLLDLVPLLHTGKVAETRNLSGEVLAEEEADSGSRRERFTTTVGRTLGIGAVLSLFVVGWQVWQDSRNAWKQDRRSEVGAVASVMQEGAGLAAQFANSEGRIQATLAGWIGSIEEIGMLHGRKAQDEAHGKVLYAAYQACSPSMLADESQKEEALRQACSIAMTVLSSQRSSPWAAVTGRYWSPEAIRGSGLGGACGPGNIDRRQLIVHAAEPMDARLDVIMRRAAEAGVEVQTSASLERSYHPAELARRVVAFRRPTLLAMVPDEACADDLHQRLRATGLADIDQIWVPGFAYAAGVIRLWLPQQPEELAAAEAGIVTSAGGNDAPVVEAGDAGGAEASTRADPPAVATAAGVAKAVVLGEGKEYLVYVQFKGDFTRAQVNRYRELLAAPGPEGSPVYRVPPAERRAGTYRNMVKYFNRDNETAAQALAAKTNLAFEQIGCPLPAPIQAERHSGRAPPNSLEVWVSPPPCGGGEVPSAADG